MLCIIKPINNHIMWPRIRLYHFKTETVTLNKELSVFNICYKAIKIIISELIKVRTLSDCRFALVI